MPGAPYYAEAFPPLLSHGHPTWWRRWADPLPGAGRPARVPWRAPNGRRYRIEACEGHRPAAVEGSGAGV